MKRRMLALALALGMLLGTTMNVAAASAKVNMPVQMKKVTDVSQEVYSEADAWNAAHMDEVCKNMMGMVPEEVYISNCHLGFPIYVY